MEKIFADGLIYKAPREGSPDFVKGSLSIKVNEFKAFIEKHDNNGWVNLDFLKSKKGSLYFALNDWKPKTNSPEEVKEMMAKEVAKDDIKVEKIPF